MVVYLYKKEREKDMYTSIASSFLNSIHSLRFYVNSVNSIITKEDELLDNDSTLAMLMIMAKELKINNINADELLFPEDFPEDTAQEIKKSLKYFSDMVDISMDGKTGRYRSLPKTVKESYIKLEASKKQRDILYSGSLMLLVTYFESTIAKIIKTDLQKHPKRLSLDTKTVSYKMLEMSNSIEDVRDLLIEDEVMAMMYKSVSDWIEYFRKNIKLKLEYATNALPELIEIIARRNIIVHNEGIVNNQYMNIVSKEYISNVKIGDFLSVDKQYILNAINLVESICMSIILEIWISESDKDNKEIGKILAIIYDEYLIFEKWENAKVLYEVCLKSNKLQLADELICKINRWQCYKWSDRFNEIEKEVEDLDVTACQPRYKLGVLALLEKYEDFFAYYDEQDDLKEDELREWPLFREVRNSEIYIQRYGICNE